MRKIEFDLPLSDCTKVNRAADSAFFIELFCVLMFPRTRNIEELLIRLAFDTIRQKETEQVS